MLQARIALSRRGFGDIKPSKNILLCKKLPDNIGNSAKCYIRLINNQPYITFVIMAITVEFCLIRKSAV